MKSSAQKLKTVLLIALKIGFIILSLGLVFNKIDVSKFGEYISSLNLLYVFFALIASIISLVISALRSRFYFHENGLQMRKSFAVIIYYIGYFFNIVLPGGIGGDGLKVFYLAKLENFSKLKSLRIILYERVNGFYALVFLSFIFFYFTDFIDVIEKAIIINSILFILVTPVYLWGVKFVLRDNIKVAINASIYSFLVQVLQVISAFFLLLSFDSIATDLVTASNFIYLFIVASILTIVPVTIGGIGMRELVFLYGMQLINYPNIEVAIAYAFMNFIIYVLTSVPGAFLIFKVSKIKRLTEKKVKRWWW